MRLLKASTIELHEFTEKKVPRYAILSHRWGDEEVSMQELKTVLPSSAQNTKGYTKIKHACALAEQYELEYIWIDTCCIDKTSSAELSEAINSMYRWYAESVLCFAHLADVELRPLADATSKRFEHSGWFRRGWTLQELLAPKTVLFFDAHWHEIGTRSALAPYITEATRIGPEFLRQKRDVYAASIAQRMSWASDRDTTRVEDIAYCLMGLFNVNMPLLYGEGRKAFLRLQRELISNYSDESIYAWEPSSWNPYDDNLSGMLASEPRCFARSGFIVSIEIPGGRQTPFSITNRGISMTLPSLYRKGKKTRDNPRFGMSPRVEIRGEYQIPMACASVHNIGAPLMLYIKEDKIGVYRRDHFVDGLSYFFDCSTKGLKWKTFHISLSSWYYYSQSLSYHHSHHALSKADRVIVRMRPVAQAELRFLSTNGQVHSVSEEPTLWQCKIGADKFVLDFQYKKRLLIYLVCTGEKFALHVEERCKLNKCKDIGIKKLEALAYGKSIKATNNAGDHDPSEDDSTVIANSLWKECTYTDLGGCQSRPLDDGNFLWLSTRMLDEPHVTPKCILDLDITTIDRRTVFER